MNKIFFLASLFLFSAIDSKGSIVDTLTLDSFLKIVKNNYPIIKKANLYDEFTAAYKIKGKGALDPKLNTSYETKNFDDKDYFSTWKNEVKIPTLLPLDLSLGYENNSGDFLNAQNKVPGNGLAYGTINLSLLRGLMFDEQRFHLKSSELKGIKSQIDKDILTREILTQAIDSYLTWAIAFNKTMIYQVFNQAVADRHNFVRQLFLNGDKPAIDTLESQINLNTAEKNYLDSKRELNNKRLKLSLFIWDNNDNPMILEETVSPEALLLLLEEIRILSEIENLNFNNDPTIRKIENQIQQVTLQNKLEKELLKPQLDLKYNSIVNLGENEFDPSLSLNDYKYGINLEIPIRNRKTRGEIRLNQVLIDQAELDKLQYSQTLQNKLQTSI